MLMPHSVAFQEILSGFSPLDSEEISLNQSCHRYLAGDVKSPEDSPPHPVATMDGYAVRCDELVGADSGLSLPVFTTMAAGMPLPPVLDQRGVVRIFTGALVPSGFDAVEIQENVSQDGDRAFFSKSGKKGAIYSSPWF